MKKRSPDAVSAGFFRRDGADPKVIFNLVQDIKKNAHKQIFIIYS